MDRDNYRTKPDADDLEILALLHYLRRTGAGEEEAKSQVEKKQERFTRQRVERMWREMGKMA